LNTKVFKDWKANEEISSSFWTCFSLIFNCGHVQLVVGKRKQIDQCRVILCKKFVYIMTHGWMRTCLSNCTGNINLLLFTKQPCCPAEDVWSQENASKMQNSNSCGPRLSGFNMYFFFLAKRFWTVGCIVLCTMPFWITTYIYYVHDCVGDHPYIASAKGLGGWGQKNGNFCWSSVLIMLT
jgi:hypothetical protein